MFNRIYAIINTNTVKIGLRYINFGPKKDKTASTDSRPVDVALPEFLESVPEHLVLVAAALGVAVDDGLCLFQRQKWRFAHISTPVSCRQLPDC